MAKKKKLFDTSCFVDEFELEIESSVKRNLDRLIDEKSIQKSHNKIVEILNAQKQIDNKYLSLEAFKFLISDLKKEKQHKEQIKAQKIEEASQNPSSSSTYN